MTDVNDLLARLKMPANGSAPTASQTPSSALSGIQQPQAQSPNVPRSLYGLASPPPSGLTGIGASTERAQSDRTANLLNLLKFNPAGQSSSAQHRAVSSSGQIKSPTSASTATAPDALLKLLNRPVAPPSGTENESKAASTVQRPAEVTSKGTVFTHVNPFDDLAATAPTASASGKPFNHGSDGTRSSKAPTPLPDGRTQVEALLGIGAKPKTQETVTEALEQAGEQARDEAADAVENAMERAESKVVKAQAEDPHAVENAMREAAEDIREDLKDDAIRRELEAEMPPEMAKGFEDTIEKVASGQDIADSWESAEAEESADEARFYTFPMKPFVAIDVKSSSPTAPRVREDIVMKVASMKREFDQVDRTLAAATTNHIVYAMMKGAGFRVIRQDDGNNKHVFKKPGNNTQVYNISITQSDESRRPEPVLATGINGSVYWTEVPVTGLSDFEESNLDAQGFQLPPVPSQEDTNTSGAQLKTRAKLSSCHPEFFAIGRGKAIYIVWPKVAMWPRYCDPKTRLVDSEKYFAERSLKIATGKAGKDFAFSRDDSLLVSLDKAGRLKFWDIKEHTDPASATSETPTVRQVDLKMPLMTLQTSQPEKSWATSVQFIDKDRPFSKGLALRYVLIGSKQNHTLTLWDLGLGKAVQEVNFPRTTDTDPICSIAYHARSSIVIVGHPTRNSVYLIHLSAPKYNLSNMSQLEFVERVSRNDSSLPRPASTAIMSGLREISLAGLGSLRSLDINDPGQSDESSTRMLELYVFHSKGVTCLNLEREDIGINKEGKPLNPVDGINTGVISWRDFEGPVQRSETSETSTVKPQEPVVKTEPSSAKKLSLRSRETEQPTAKPANGASSTAAAPEMTEKRSTAPESAKQPATFASIARGQIAKVSEPVPKAPAAIPQVQARPPSPPAQPVVADNSTARAAETMVQAVSTARTPEPRPSPASATAGQVLGADQIDELRQSISQGIGGVFSGILTGVLSDQIEKLYHKIEEDKRIQEAAQGAKQDAILRLVSSTLTNNVEKSLDRIVSASIDDKVVPSVNTVVAEAVNKKVKDTLTPQVANIFPKELKSALTPAINQAMQSPELVRHVSDAVTGNVLRHVEQVFATTLRNNIAPSFQNLAVESARRMVGEVDSKVREQFQVFEMRSNKDSAKIDQLTGLTSELLQTVRTMAGQQGELQTEILTLKTELKQYQQQATEAAASNAIKAESVPRSMPQDSELESIAELMSEGGSEEGTIKWLQSTRQDEIFDNLFVGINPQYLQQCNQIVILSVAAAVTSTLETNTAQRLAWLEMTLACLDAESPEIRDHAGGVMDAITPRLQDAYMQLAEEAHPDMATQQRVHKLVRRAKEIKILAG